MADIDSILTPTKAETTNALRIMLAVAESIRELGEVPSGHLYAGLMGKLDIHQYNAVIASLKRAKLVEEKFHLLRWIGPMKEVR